MRRWDILKAAGLLFGALVVVQTVVVAFETMAGGGTMFDYISTREIRLLSKLRSIHLRQASNTVWRDAGGRI